MCVWTMILYSTIEPNGVCLFLKLFFNATLNNFPLLQQRSVFRGERIRNTLVLTEHAPPHKLALHRRQPPDILELSSLSDASTLHAGFHIVFSKHSSIEIIKDVYWIDSCCAYKAETGIWAWEGLTTTYASQWVCPCFYPPKYWLLSCQ